MSPSANLDHVPSASTRHSARIKAQPASPRRGDPPQRRSAVGQTPALLLLFTVILASLAVFVHRSKRPQSISVETARDARQHQMHTWSNEGCAEVILEQQHRLLDVFSRELKHHRSVAILGFPSHENKGDSAIWVGEKILLAALGVNTVYQADWQTYSRTQLAMTINRHPDLLILLHGGGNFGDLYPWEMDGRLKVVQHFPDTPIRFFPQSIHFNDHARMLDVRDQLVQHSDLGVVVRDVPSLERANALFAQTDVKVMYAPDAALMIGARPDLRNRTTPDHDILLFHRFDAEATEWFDEDTFTDYETLIADWGMKEYGLTYPKYSHFDSQAVDRFEAGARFLGSGKIAVLNRLHGHILAILLGIPHIIVDNKIGKLSAYYHSWTSTCQLGLLAESPKHALRLAEQYVEHISTPGHNDIGQ